MLNEKPATKTASTVLLTTILLCPTTSHAKFTLKSNGNGACKAQVTLKLPSIDMSCSTDERSGNPSSWFNPNAACNLSFDLIGLPSLSDITAGLTAEACAAIDVIKNETYDKVVSNLNSKIPDNLYDEIKGNADLTSASKDIAKDVMNDLNEIIASNQTGSTSEADNKPTMESINDDIKDSFGQEICFTTDDAGEMLGINCGKTIAEQIQTPEMTNAEVESLKKTSLPYDCYEKTTFMGDEAREAKFKCHDPYIDAEGNERIKVTGFYTLPKTQAYRSDRNGCFNDNVGRSICTDGSGKGSLNFNQGYFAATSGTFPTACEKEQSGYVCPTTAKLDYTPIPANCYKSSKSASYTCNTIEAAQLLVKDEFWCFATHNNQRACLKEMKGWEASKPIESKSSTSSYKKVASPKKSVSESNDPWASWGLEDSSDSTDTFSW